jgi:DNA polymerase-3 subunit beta
MKTLIKLANSSKIEGIGGFILFEGNAARATDVTMHAVIESGPWNFDCATLVSVQQIKTAMAISKKPVWSGDTLNGIKLVPAGTTDWPELPAFAGSRIKVDPVKLAASLAQCAPAMADNDVRYYLNGMCFDHDAKAIVGCDGHRLHIVKSAYDTDLTGQAIVPRDALDVVGVKNILHMDFTDTHVRIGYVGGYLITRLCEGKFMDYSRVLPHVSDRAYTRPFNSVQCDAVKTMVAINKANKSKYGTIAIDASGSIVAHDVTLPCFEQFNINLDKWPDGSLKGQDYLCINAKYLHDAMVSAGNGEIRANGPNDSLLIINGDFSAVVMPCR